MVTKYNLFDYNELSHL